MRIFKYPLKITDKQEIELPVNARILTVQVQAKVPCLWALVDEELSGATRKHYIRTYGTGHFLESPSDCLYLGTYQLNNGSIVFHVFDEFEKGD